MEMAALKSSEVRSNFASFVDKVFQNPVFMTRRNQLAVTTSKAFIEEITPLVVSVAGEPQDYVAKLSGVPTVAGYGASESEAKNDLALALKEYVELYFDDLQENLRFPNLREEFFLMTALQGKTEREIVKAFHA